MNKRYNDKGEVAVLYSPGYGAGWYSWNEHHLDCLFNPEIVDLALERQKLVKNTKEYDAITQKILDLAEKTYDDFYADGARSLDIKWMKPGTLFKIKEYDGYESIEYAEHQEWLVA